VLRSPRDDDDAQPETTRMADLRGEDDEYYGAVTTPPPPPVVAVAPTTQPTTAPAAPRRVWVMKVIRGGTVTEMAFPVPPSRLPPSPDGAPLPERSAVTGAGDGLQEEAQ
jgi:hypothetical protein